jgi:DNA-binding transcriptional MerR regulator
VPLSRSRDYLSIGEVLDNLKADFPDASISKIRFLESEGLISPERTPAGYRKFYEGDLDRLRYILSLQRDHFLPLRIIKERLRDADASGGYPSAVPSAPASQSSRGNGHAGAASAADAAGRGSAAPVSSVQLGRAELTAAAGLTDAQLKGLEEFGILSGAEPYDENDLVVAKAAKRFFDFGVEARHLRMYRQFAEREAAFFEQIVAPGARRSDPSARDEATRSVEELAGASRQMKEAALRSSLRAIR